MRIGEATNPGPTMGLEDKWCTIGAAAYKNPGQEGFRHAILPAPTDYDQGGEKEMFSLTIETVNATAWGSMARYLQRTRAQLVLCQEHHLGPGATAAAAAFALRLGWQPMFLPAEPGEGEGWRAGVAIFARNCIGISPPMLGAAEVIPARALAVLVEAPGYRPFHAIAMYMEHGQGVGPKNLRHLEDVGAFLEMQPAHTPFVVGADFQCPPEELSRAGFASRVSASIVATGDPRGTCRSAVAISELDYFIIHHALTPGIADIRLVEGAGIAPHVPVQVSFRPRLASTRTLVLRHPPRLGTERVHGPVPHPPDWQQVASEAAALLNRVRDANFKMDEDFRGRYAALYVRWADMAEGELIGATIHDEPIKKTGLRGRPPVLVWRSLQSEKTPELAAHHVDLDKWRTMATVTQEIRGALLWLVPHAMTDRWMEQPGEQGRRAPVPRRDEDNVAGDILDKLDAIRDQLAEDMNDTDTATMPGHDTLGDAGAEGGEPARLADVARELHILACSIQVAIHRTEAARRDGGHFDSQQLLQRLIPAMDRIADTTQARLRQAAAAHKAAKLNGWRAWVAEDIANGARNAHRYLKLPAEWRPTTTLTIDGVLTAEPRKLLENYTRKYDALWNGAHRQRMQRRRHLHDELGGQHQRPQRGGEGERDDGGCSDEPWLIGRSDPLPRPEPSDIRDAARSFSERTAVAFDGIAMRHYGLMSDGALGVVADFIEIMESTGEMPRQLGLTEMPMLGKPRGGHRAVATIVGLYRIWARLRKPYVTAWEAAHDRPYLAAGKGRSPQSSVWRQACLAEAAVEKGQASATILWDLASFFEAIKRLPLWHRARRLEFPTALLRVALTTYSLARVLSLGGILSQPLPAHDGVLAGCGMAMALTRAYVIGPLDAVVDQFGAESALRARLDMFVDDIALAANGTIGQVVNRLSNAAELLQDVIEGPLACSIEIGKAAVVSSSRVLTDMLRRRFGARAGDEQRTVGSGARARLRQRRGRRMQQSPHHRQTRGTRPGTTEGTALNLGVDFAAGRKRATHGKATKRSQRLATLRIKTAKLVRIKAIAGRRTPLIFMAGPLPEGIFGAAVNGLSDKEALAVRRCAAQAFAPRAKGRSLSTLLLLHDMPTWRSEVEVALEYSRQLWQASLLGGQPSVDGTLTLPEIARIWHAVDTNGIISSDGMRRNWQAVRGPIGAMRLSLHRIGWDMVDPFTMRDHDGERIILTTTSPALLATMLRHAVIRALQLQVAGKMAVKDPTLAGRRIAADHVIAQLKR